MEGKRPPDINFFYVDHRRWSIGTLPGVYKRSYNTSISCTKLSEFIGHPGCMYVLMMTSLVWAGGFDSVSSGALTLCCYQF